MLLSARIQNYQSHEETVLNFTPGVNVIKGTSYTGKSGVVRALRWALQNRPVGWGFKPHDLKDGETLTELEFDDGVIIRGKNKVDNYYVVNDLHLSAIRTELPTEVTDVSRMNDINLVSQFDGHFLLSDTPGNVAKKVNEVLGTEIVDRALYKASSMIAKADNRIPILTQDVEKLKEEEKKYENLEQAKKEYEVLKARMDRLEEIEEQVDQLEELKTDILLSEDRVNLFNSFLEAEEEYNRVMVITLRKAKLSIEGTKLESLTKEIKVLKTYIEKGKEFVVRENFVNETIMLCKKRAEQTTLLNAYLSIASSKKTVGRLVLDVLTTEERYTLKLKSLAICPLCGQEIK
jgi:exonuclease SbcC